MIKIQSGSDTTTHDDVIKATFALLDLLVDCNYVAPHLECGELVIDLFDRPDSFTPCDPPIVVSSANPLHPQVFERAVSHCLGKDDGMVLGFEGPMWDLMKKHAVLYAFRAEASADISADDLLEGCDEQSFVDALHVYLEGGHLMAFEFMLATIKAA